MTLLLAKILSTILIVLVLSSIAERAGPALAGTLAGIPLGVAIVFFFIGIEQGPYFVTDAAPYTIAGFAATLCFNLAYWFVSSRVHRYQFAAATVSALIFFLIVAFATTQISLNVWSATLLVAVVAVLSMIAMRSHDETKIDKRLKMTWIVMALRAGIAVAVVLAVTGLAQTIGPEWAGLLAGFPITLFPLLIIMHISYSAEDAGTVLKAFPYGLPSLVVFVLCAWAVFEPLGVPLGFIVSLMVSVLWLVALFVLKSRWRDMQDLSGD
ncbi:hypothetical protein [Hoeflea sp. TYP-13]|uniref:hypothetical protein n=1 Tax=Hoeflea sp. TYP-13 TaxID=3230023 RepID=UPI0034C6DD85